MTVRTFALALLPLALGLLLIGWQTASPVGFVGIALLPLSAILLWTRKRRANEVRDPHGDRRH